jgi:hypothetical protein
MSDNPVQRWHAHNPAATPTHADLKKVAAYAVGFADGHKQADRIEALLNLNEALVELMDDLNAKLAKAVDLLTDAIEDESEFETDWNKLTRAFLAEQGENP